MQRSRRRQNGGAASKWPCHVQPRVHGFSLLRRGLRIE
jgi:hypothetical protein